MKLLHCHWKTNQSNQSVGCQEINKLIMPIQIQQVICYMSLGKIIVRLSMYMDRG